MNEKSIWEMFPNKSQRQKSADFAAKTLAWTFNRMSMNTSPAGQIRRALNIVKGILAQEMLGERLEAIGIEVITDNSFRSPDMFDFLIKKGGRKIKLDLKTNQHYNNYPDDKRSPLTKALIAEHSDYPGPDWRTFFPMLMPHNQMRQDKEAYCFGISSSIDFRKDISTDRDDYYLCAFPYGKGLKFYSSSKLCRLREENSKGYYLKIKYIDEEIFNKKISFEIIGEWNAKYKIQKISLKPNDKFVEVGPFSIISSFRVFKEDWENFNGKIEIKVSKNDFKEEVLDSSRKNINIIPEENLFLSKDNFCNLILPKTYILYLIGWIDKVDFIKKCKSYKAWVWPKDSVNKFENQEWSQITENDMRAITNLGFEDCITKKPTKFSAGWIKTTGRGGGGCCYVFPNIGRGGGVLEHNLFVLPSDLNELTLLFKKK